MYAIKEGHNFTCAKAGPNDLDLYECNCQRSDFDRLGTLQLKINNKLFDLPRDSWVKFDASEEKPCKILMHPYDISMTATYRWVLGI